MQSIITFENKVALNENADIPAVNKIRDVDINEIKAIVNDSLQGTNAMGSIVVDDVKCKNMFVPTLFNVDSSIVVHDCTITLTDDEFTITTTGSDVYFGNVNGAGNNYINNRGVLIDVSGLSQITFTITNPIFTNNYIT